MQRLAAAALPLSLFGLSVLLTAIAILCNFSSADETSIELLTTGHIEDLLGRSVWSRYPEMPSPFMAMFDWTALLTTLVPFGCVAWALRRQPHGRTLLFGVAFAVGFIPYLAGRVALRNNTMPELCGPWIATMLLGLAYGLVLCAILAIREMCRRPTSTAPRATHDGLQLSAE